MFPYVIGTEPVFDITTEYLQAGEILLIESVWTEVWDIITMTVEQQEFYQRESDMLADLALLRADAEVLQLLRARPTAINTYIDNNVTDLASAKTVLKTLSRAIAVVAHTTIN